MTIKYIQQNFYLTAYLNISEYATSDFLQFYNDTTSTKLSKNIHPSTISTRGFGACPFGSFSFGTGQYIIQILTSTSTNGNNDFSISTFDNLGNEGDTIELDNNSFCLMPKTPSIKNPTYTSNNLTLTISQ